MVEKNRSVGLTPSTTNDFSFYYQGEFYKTISLPVWVNELDFENNTVKSYDFGQTIPREDCEGKLGVVIAGTVEVLDSIKCTQLGVIAHRPTRVFTKGDTFGEFELLEESPKKDVIPEPYYLAAGRICFLVAKKINRKDFESIYNCSGINFNIYKNYPSTKSYTSLPKTVISWISLKSITAGQKNIPRGLLQSAYDKIITYKLSINSYNLHLLLEFRDKCVLRIMNLDKKVKQSSRILAPLLDAIFDTLNRPLRGAPMYQFGWPTELADLNLPVVGYLGSKDSKDFLHATHSTIGIFYFPIDLPESVSGFPARSIFV